MVEKKRFIHDSYTRRFCMMAAGHRYILRNYPAPSFLNIAHSEQPVPSQSLCKSCISLSSWKRFCCLQHALLGFQKLVNTVEVGEVGRRLGGREGTYMIQTHTTL